MDLDIIRYDEVIFMRDAIFLCINGPTEEMNSQARTVASFLVALVDIRKLLLAERLD